MRSSAKLRRRPDLGGRDSRDGNVAESGSAPPTPAPPPSGATAVRDAACLAAGRGLPVALVVAADRVFWTAACAGTGRVFAAPVRGGDAVTVDACRAVQGVAASASHVYWTGRDGESGGGGGGVVRAVALRGGAPVTVAADQADPRAVVADRTHVYWINGGDGAVLAVPHPTGDDAAAPARLAPSLVAVGVRRTHALAAGGGFVYWADGAAAAVVRSDRDGESPVTVLSVDADADHGASYVLAIAADDEGVAWTTSAGLVVVSRLDETAPRVVATAQAYPSSVALDGTHAYWTNFRDGTVARVPRDGGPVELLTTSSGDDAPAAGDEPCAVAVDDEAVYWASLSTGALFRIVKPV